MGNCCCCGYWGVDTDIEVPILPVPECPADWQGKGAPWKKEPVTGPVGKWEDFAGVIPDAVNVAWAKPCNAPAEVAFATLIRDPSKGGKYTTIKAGEEGSGVFPSMQNGAVVCFENLNYQVMSISKDDPYSFSYRVFETQVPAFKGVTASISFIPNPDDSDKCTMVFNGKFDNNAPCAVISFITKNVVLGPLTSEAEKMWTTKEYTKFYDGPAINSPNAAAL